MTAKLTALFAISRLQMLSIIRRIAMAAPTCTLWEYDEKAFAFRFRPVRRLTISDLTRAVVGAF